MASPDPDPALLADLARLATEIAEEAGALLLERLPGERTVETKSSIVDAVTEVDREAEALIVRRILEARPDDAIFGEEGANLAGTSGVRWVIDPLDGTVNYLYRRGAFCVSVAVEVAGRPSVGVVRDPSLGETFAAVVGQGATLNGAPIRVSAPGGLARSLIGTGFGYEASVRRAQGAVAGRLIPQVRDIRRAGSAALDLCAVACGRLDGYYERGVQPWDVAAGVIIVREAGGRAEPLDPPEVSAPTWVAASPGLFDELRAAVIEAGA